MSKRDFPSIELMKNHLNLLKEKNAIVLYESFKGEIIEVARVPYKGKEVILKAVAKDMKVQFLYGHNEDQLSPMGDPRSLIIIADAQGNAQFNGAGIGIYATSNGLPTKNTATYDWFSYEGKDRSKNIVD